MEAKTEDTTPAQQLLIRKSSEGVEAIVASVTEENVLQLKSPSHRDSCMQTLRNH